jgi:hypothetical protein
LREAARLLVKSGRPNSRGSGLKSPKGIKIRCPICNQLDVRRSEQFRLLDQIMSPFHRDPLRCRNCRFRFYRRTDESEK